MRLLVLCCENDQECDKCLDIIESDEILFEMSTVINIDSDEIKNVIMSSRNIEITQVPTVLAVDEKGKISKFEGMSLIESLLNKILESIPAPEPEEEIEDDKTPGTTALSFLGFEDDDEEEDEKSSRSDNSDDEHVLIKTKIKSSVSIEDMTKEREEFDRQFKDQNKRSLTDIR